MALTTYCIKRNGREYVYAYDRSLYPNNTKDYNKNYWAEHKSELKKKAKLKRIEKHLENIVLSEDTKKAFCDDLDRTAI